MIRVWHIEHHGLILDGLKRKDPFLTGADHRSIVPTVGIVNLKTVVEMVRCEGRLRGRISWRHVKVMIKTYSQIT